MWWLDNPIHVWSRNFLSEMVDPQTVRFDQVSPDNSVLGQRLKEFIILNKKNVLLDIYTDKLIKLWAHSYFFRWMFLIYIKYIRSHSTCQKQHRYSNQEGRCKTVWYFDWSYLIIISIYSNNYISWPIWALPISFEALKNRSGSFVWPVKRFTFIGGIRKWRCFGGGNFIVQK